MKKPLILIGILNLACLGNAQNINIPDANFKAKLISQGVDANNDGEIQQIEAFNLTGGLFLNSANINSLEGLQYFSNIITLDCSFNPITELNLCGTSVFRLTCTDNPYLTTINLKNNVISHTFWTEPPLAPFWAHNLQALQHVCSDAGEETYAFTMATTNTITFTTDCDISDCSNTLNTPHNLWIFDSFVYPNPVIDNLNIQFAENINIKSIHIVNTLGQLVKSISTPSETINVSELKSGNYFIKVVSDKGTATGKFIKE